MGETLIGIAAAVLSACLFFMATIKLQGVLQQGNYKNHALFKWLFKKENPYMGRLSLWAGMCLLLCALTLVCFSFGGAKLSKALSAIPFLLVSALFIYADGKRALKVSLKKTSRIKRLSAVYLLLLLCFNYAVIAVLSFLAKAVGGEIFAFVCYLPFLVAPLFLPLVLALANLIDGVYENARNKKFVKTAKKALLQSSALKIAVVGSYGKTSVKNILKDILSVKYKTIATPESYNTPLGIAKTVHSEEFQNAEVFVAEMGARKAGDIQELCSIVQPDYAIFTGVCAQHIQTFGSVENVFQEKCEIIKSSAKKIICGEQLKERVLSADFLSEEEKAKCVFVRLDDTVEDVRFESTFTSFSLKIDERKISVETKLLSAPAVENICLATTLLKELSLSIEELEKGIALIEPIPHRLQLMQANGVYILDDAYNTSEVGARRAIQALERFGGKKIIVTPGIVETGVLEREINFALGKEIAKSNVDECVLVGETLVKAVKDGFLSEDGKEENIRIFPTLEKAQAWLSENLNQGDCVLFLNDLPDVY